MSCKFKMAWVAHPPADNVDGGDFCPTHSGVRCKCGSEQQALGECYATPGPLVCGHLYCATCVPELGGMCRFHSAVLDTKEVNER